MSALHGEPLQRRSKLIHGPKNDQIPGRVSKVCTTRSHQTSPIIHGHPSKELPAYACCSAMIARSSRSMRDCAALCGSKMVPTTAQHYRTNATYLEHTSLLMITFQQRRLNSASPSVAHTSFVGADGFHCLLGASRVGLQSEAGNDDEGQHGLRTSEHISPSQGGSHKRIRNMVLN